MVALTHWVVSSFSESTADVLAPRLSIVFRQLRRLSTFLIYWRMCYFNSESSTYLLSNQLPPLSISSARSYSDSVYDSVVIRVLIKSKANAFVLAYSALYFCFLLFLFLFPQVGYVVVGSLDR